MLAPASKSVLDACNALKFLGMWVDVNARTFTISAKKLATFEAPRAQVATLKFVPFRMLERLVGKAMSFVVAVPSTKLLCICEGQSSLCLMGLV